MTVDDIRKALAAAGPLLNQQQVARRLGRDPATVHHRRKAGTMPEPVATDGAGKPLWLPEQVDGR